MVEKEYRGMSVVAQCNALNIHRSGLYYSPVPESEENLEIMRYFDEQYINTPFFGVRKLTVWLRDEKDVVVNHKRVKRLMDLMGWQTIFRKKNLSKRKKGEAVFPYLLRGIEINRPNQAWAIDITYIPMRKGFMYLCAIIDIHTRYVVAWSICNTMSAEWVRAVVEEAINENGCPEIINSDQGSQFTSYEYTSLLIQQGISISMDGKGRAIDNIFIERLWKSVKHECVYLKAFEDGVQLYAGLKEYFEFYNNKRAHQSLNYRKPAQLYKLAA